MGEETEVGIIDWRGTTVWGGELGVEMGALFGWGLEGLGGLVWVVEVDVDEVYGFGLGGFWVLVWGVA
jgi:hypothetical protein